MMSLLPDKGEARVAGHTFEGRVDVSVERVDTTGARPNRHLIITKLLDKMQPTIHARQT